MRENSLYISSIDQKETALRNHLRGTYLRDVIIALEHLKAIRTIIRDLKPLGVDLFEEEARIRGREIERNTRAKLAEKAII